MQTFFSHGKLLLTGEYVVLDQALALAVPTQLGQRMEVAPLPSKASTNSVKWTAYDINGGPWLSETIDLDEPAGDSMLAKLIFTARALNPDFLQNESYEVNTFLDFKQNWGLGSSSTLICNLAKWAQVDAFTLSEASFGGSGYDIAVGMLGGDVLYRSPDLWEGYVFNPSFKDQLFLVHLNKKQNSREGIKTYRSKETDPTAIQAISSLTEKIVAGVSFDQFQEVLNEHEAIISKCIGMETIKKKHFSDYPFSMKSLGAWGGDFILACGDDSSPKYFASKGFDTVLSYKSLIK